MSRTGRKHQCFTVGNVWKLVSTVASVCGTLKLLSVIIFLIYSSHLFVESPSLLSKFLNPLKWYDFYADIFSVSQGNLFLSDVKGHEQGHKGLKQPLRACTSQLLEPLSSWHTSSHMPVCFFLTRVCLLVCLQEHIACQCWITITPKAWISNITRSGSWTVEVSTSPLEPSLPACSSSSSITAVSTWTHGSHDGCDAPPQLKPNLSLLLGFSPFQSTPMDCVTLLQMCVLWLNLKPRGWPRMPGRFPESPSASTWNWDRAVLEKSGWVRTFSPHITSGSTAFLDRQPG